MPAETAPQSTQPDLRAEIADPTFNQDFAANANNKRQIELAGKVIDARSSGPVEKNYVTRTDSDIAQDVANAIKPEIDVIADTREGIENPLRHALSTADGHIISRENVPALELKKKAAEADLERNSEAATKLAIKKGIGRMSLRHTVER